MRTRRNALNLEARSCILTAMIGLSREKPLGSISITELCRAAGVSRMAFYRNFASKEEVLSARVDELIDEYRRATASLARTPDLWFDEHRLGICFCFLRQNSDLLECMYRCGLTGEVVNAVSDFLIERWGDGGSAREYVLSSFSGALCSCYARWANRGFPEDPRVLARLLSRSYSCSDSEQ